MFAVVEAPKLPFLVMEYVPGRSLQDRLDKLGPLTLSEILRIGMQTAAGLAAAHAQGLVHRDVKPANILLEDGIERVRLTDFGLARAAADAAMTQSGVVAGTPHYMAPEQARGEMTDHRADLFSLGSTLYAMCAGHPPFRAESPLAVLRRVCDDEPRPLRSINPDVPDWLEVVVARLMAKDRARRYQTASEVADVLGRCLAHIQQPSTSPLPKGLEVDAATRTPARTKRRLVAAAALVLAGVVPLAAGAWFVRSRGQSPNPALRPSIRSVDASQSMRSVDSPLSRVVHDELQRLLDDARNRARAVHADILERPKVVSLDPISERSVRLTGELKALKRDILSSLAVPDQPLKSLPSSNP